MVPKAGLEPARLTPPPPQDGVSTNSTTSANLVVLNTQGINLPFITVVYFIFRCYRYSLEPESYFLASCAAEE